MKANDDDIKYPIPEKFRASLDVTDEAAHALLLECDKQQAELAARINEPFTRNTPQERARSKAAITLQSLEQASQFMELLPDQYEIMAECHAAMGRYDLAADISLKHEDLYLKYWEAVFRLDSAWCLHPDKHKYTKENIFSTKHGKEMPLLACNICDTWNVADEPDSIKTARTARADVRAAKTWMSDPQFSSFMEANHRKR